MSVLLKTSFFISILFASTLYASADLMHKWAGFLQEHDLNQDGVIHGNEEMASLRQFFLKEGVREEQVLSALGHADENWDGAIDEEEYRDLRMALLEFEV